MNSSDTELLSLLKSLDISLVERRFVNEMREEIMVFRDRNLLPDGRIQEGELRAFSFEEFIGKMNQFPQDRDVLKKISDLQKLLSLGDRVQVQRTKRALQAGRASDL